MTTSTFCRDGAQTRKCTPPAVTSAPTARRRATDISAGGRAQLVPVCDVGARREEILSEVEGSITPPRRSCHERVDGEEPDTPTPDTPTIPPAACSLLSIRSGGNHEPGPENARKRQ